MSLAAESLRALLEPLLGDFALQYAHWKDPGLGKRSSLLKPAGGAPGELVRRPQFTLSLIGGADDDRIETSKVADGVCEALRTSSGDLVFVQAAEPVFHPTADGRPVFEIALGAITN